MVDPAIDRREQQTGLGAWPQVYGSSPSGAAGGTAPTGRPGSKKLKPKNASDTSQRAFSDAECQVCPTTTFGVNKLVQILSSCWLVIAPVNWITCTCCVYTTVKLLCMCLCCLLSFSAMLTTCGLSEGGEGVWRLRMRQQKSPMSYRLVKMTLVWRLTQNTGWCYSKQIQLFYLLISQTNYS